MWLGVHVGLSSIEAIGWNLALPAGAILTLVPGGDGRGGSPRTRKFELESILQGLPEAVFLLDERGRVIYLNKPAESLAGQASGALLRLDAQALSEWIVAPKANDQTEFVVDRVLRGETIRHERSLFRGVANSEPIEVLISGSPMHDRSGRLIGALVVMQDVTELTELQRQIASSERHFAVGQMTAGLAHDFANVLTTIAQAARILAMESARTEGDRQMLDVIENAVRRGSEIVTNIRGYLRGRPEPRSLTDMRRLLEEVLQLMQPVIAMHDDITVEHQMEEGCEAYANAPELRRVFTNLILNALDAMPLGGTLTLCCSRSRVQITVSIKDTGVGIPAETQKLIFSPYFTTKPEGTGLGLTGARRTIQAQGGDIRFETTPGSGTTFYVVLPPADGEQQKPKAA